MDDSGQSKALVVFQDKKIRRVWHDEEWYFSVVDIVMVLTDSQDPNDYWYRLKKREMESSKIELSTFCRQLKLLSSDGKYYLSDCANTEGIFRIIQSIPSPKAEPFKLWLAQVGYDEIKILESQSQRHLSEFVSNNLLGFEITSAEPTYTIIKSVSDVNPQEVNSMVLRALLLLSNICKKEDSYKRQSALKLIYASKRAISKFGQCNYNKSLILFSLLSELEVSEDTKKIKSSYESFQKYDASKLNSGELALAFC